MDAAASFGCEARHAKTLKAKTFAPRSTEARRKTKANNKWVIGTATGGLHQRIESTESSQDRHDFPETRRNHFLEGFRGRFPLISSADEIHTAERKRGTLIFAFAFLRVSVPCGEAFDFDFPKKKRPGESPAVSV